MSEDTVAEYLFIPMSAYTDLPVTEVYSVVGLPLEEELGFPVGTSAKHVIFGDVDELGMRFLLTPAGSEGVDSVPRRAHLPTSNLIQLPGETCSREQVLTLRKDSEGRAVTEVIAVPKIGVVSAAQVVGTGTYCPQIRMPNLYGSASSIGEEELAMEKELDVIDTSFAATTTANLPHPDTWDTAGSSYITVKRLQVYAQSRDLPCSDMLRPALLEMCKKYWEQEVVRVQKGEQVFIRNPTGSSGMSWMLGYNASFMHSALDALNSRLPAPNSPDWEHKTPTELQGRLPYMPASTMMTHWQKQMNGNMARAFECKVMRAAWKRVAVERTITEFAVHQGAASKDAEAACSEVWVKWQCKASMKTCAYKCHVCLTVVDGEVWQINSAGCQCKASALQRCHHIAALCLILHYAPRVNSAGDVHISPTAKLCRWIVPSDIFNTSLKLTPLRAMHVRRLERFGQAGTGPQKGRELMVQGKALGFG